MIPTTLTNSPPPPIGVISPNLTFNTSGSTSASDGNSVLPSYTPALLGIASLILEGRAFMDDDYTAQSGVCKSDCSVEINFVGEMGRRSPEPSTSRVAYSELALGRDANEVGTYLACKVNNSMDSGLYIDTTYSSSGSGSAASSFDSQQARWSQKLSQLRQESPSSQGHEQVAMETSISRSSEAEYVALALNPETSSPGERSADFEIVRRVALNRINSYNSTVMMGGIGGSGSSSFSTNAGGFGQDNSMSSLQSLATNTCLRVGTPFYNSASTPKYCFRTLSGRNNRTTTAHIPSPHLSDISVASTSNSISSSSCGSVQSPKPQHWWRHLTPATTLAQNTPTITRLAGPRQTIPKSTKTDSPLVDTALITQHMEAISPSNVRKQNKPQQGPHCDQFLRKMGLTKAGDGHDIEEHYCDLSYVNITCTRWRAYCLKMEAILGRGEAICIEVYLGPVSHKVLLEQWILTIKDKQPAPTMTLPSLCSAIRSQLYFSQVSAWCDLIKKADKTVYETGRLIFTTPRSSAAGDLVTSTPTSTQQHSPNTSATLGGGGGGGGSPLVGYEQKRPRLNIFYRIKQYDETACFKSKPNVHNFPNVNITDCCCVSVCLKNLPRFSGGIPPTVSHGQPLASATETITTTTTTTTVTIHSTNRTSDALKQSSNINCDNLVKKQQQQQQQQQQLQEERLSRNMPTTALLTHSVKNCAGGDGSHVNCAIEKTKSEASKTNPCTAEDEVAKQEELFAEESSNSNSNGNNVSDDGGSFYSASALTSNENLTHRERQLMKYRKRMFRRDKKHRKDNDVVGSNRLNAAAAGFKEHMEPMSSYGKQLCESPQLMDQGDEGDEEEEEDDGEDDGGDGEDDEDGGHSLSYPQQQEPAKKWTVEAMGINQRQHQHLIENEKNSNSNGTNVSILASADELETTTTAIPTTTHHEVKMISTGTQTPANYCHVCGNAKTLVCLQCNKHMVPMVATTSSVGGRRRTGHIYSSRYSYDDINDAEMDSSSGGGSSGSSLSSGEIIHTPRNKAELLLQAIQRTPKIAKKYRKSKAYPEVRHKASTSHDNGNGNNNHLGRVHSKGDSGVVAAIESGLGPGIGGGSGVENTINDALGCQVCKRQKTQHNFIFQEQEHIGQPSSSSSSTSATDPSHTTSENISESESLNATTTTTTQYTALIDNKNHTTAMVDNASYNAADNKPETLINVQGGATNENNHEENRFHIEAAVAHRDNNEKPLTYLEKEPEEEDHTIMEEEYFETSTKLTPHIELCSLITKRAFNYLPQRSQSQQQHCKTPPLAMEETKIRDDADDDADDCVVESRNNIMAQFKTPTQEYQSAAKAREPSETPNPPSILKIVCNFHHGGGGDKMQTDSDESPATAAYHRTCENLNNNRNDNSAGRSGSGGGNSRRNLLKVNLTPIFCNSTALLKTAASVAASAPIPIRNKMSFIGSAVKSDKFSDDGNNSPTTTTLTPAFNFETPASPTLMTLAVQKSNSAPALPNSPSLSPRFTKTVALCKRRSRHISDRSMGSDEQYSDEDVDCGLFSPFAISPIKMRSPFSNVFARKPLLGNLEESLLQRRLIPKVEVTGFRLLLGASGNFCPTQLTIPAGAYFYELHGNTLSTPYLCEVRLPRKGYSIPRFGTVQATLLNPMGTVVRMFVIPYDMRDMPALHQTFVRQRILADRRGAITTELPIESALTTMKQCNGGGGGDDGGDGDGDGNRKNMTIKANHHHHQHSQQQQQQQQQQRSPNCRIESNLGHFISSEDMKSLRYSIHLRFQTSRSGRLMLHTDIRLLISRRTDCDTAAAHARGVLEGPNALITDTVMPTSPKYSARQEQPSTSKI